MESIALLLIAIWMVIPWAILGFHVVAFNIHSWRKHLFAGPDILSPREKLAIISATRRTDPELDRLVRRVVRWFIVTLAWWILTMLGIGAFALFCIAFLQ